MTKDLVFASVVASLVMSSPVILISVSTNLPDDALVSALLLPSLASIGPMILYHTVPVLAALAIVWCYSNFLQNGALVALYASGRCEFSVRMPALVVATGAMIVGYLLSMVVAPHTARHLHDVLYSIRYNLTPSLLKVGEFNQFGRNGDVVFIERRVGHRKFSNVFIFRRSIDGEERVYVAQNAVFEQQGEEQFIILFNGSVQVAEQNMIRTVSFENIMLPMAKSAAAARTYRIVDELDTADFLRERVTALADPAQARNWTRELFNRFVIPGLVLTHVFLGLELLASSGALHDRKRNPVAPTCAGIAVVHFFEVFAVEQITSNIYWTWAVGALILGEFAAAVALMFMRLGKGSAIVDCARIEAT